jgi:hypothetical protein
MSSPLPAAATAIDAAASALIKRDTGLRTAGQASGEPLRRRACW